MGTYINAIAFPILMTFSQTFAVISDYRKVSLKTTVQVHAVVLSDKCTELPEVFPYIITKPDTTPYDELRAFLESVIPENCEVYAGDGYYKKYSTAIKELEQKYTFKKISDAPECIQVNLSICFAKANNDSDKDIKKRIKQNIDAMFAGENVEKNYINSVVENA